MKLHRGFPRLQAPGSGRMAVRLTQGGALSYPLYYYTPSLTVDLRFLVFHRADRAGVQLWRLELATGEQAPLTRATGKETHWFPWCVDKGPGVRDHLSALNLTRNSVVFFDDRKACEVDVPSAKLRPLFELPPHRVPIGQNCMSPDDEWFVFIHHDAESHRRMKSLPYQEARQQSKGTVLAAYHFASREVRDLLCIDSPIHHVLPHGSDELIFCHPRDENGMLRTTMAGGTWTHLRPRDENGGTICHFVSSAVGLHYEVTGRSDGIHLAGLLESVTGRTLEIPLPRGFGYTHTGRDPLGKTWIFENERRGAHPECRLHDLWFLSEHRANGEDVWEPLFEGWQNGSAGQSSHCHPQMVGDREWILFVGGDMQGGKSQIHLLEAGDLGESKGVLPR